MADLLRRQIIDALKTRVTGLLTTGTNVFEEEVQPIQASKLPALIILAGENTATENSSIGFPAYQQYELEILVEVRVKSSATPEKTADTIEKEVIVGVLPDGNLGGKCRAIQFMGSETPEKSGEGNQPLFIKALTFVARYGIVENAPDVLV